MHCKMSSVFYFFLYFCFFYIENLKYFIYNFLYDNSIKNWGFAMKKILVVSNDEKIINTVKDGCSAFAEDFDFCVKTDKNDIISYINYELPEIKVLDYGCEETDCGAILQVIHDDPWLHYGGVMAVCADRMQVKELEALKDSNLISIQTRESFSFHFARILRILWQNQQFLASHGLQEMIGSEETGSFICGNDPFDHSFYTMFLVNYLFNTNRINVDDRLNLQVALSELLTNALEHGNLNISRAEKAEFKKLHGDVSALVKERSADPKYAQRQITLIYTISRETTTFTIRDEGAGFEWRKYMAGTANMNNTSNGRGIALVRTLVNNLSYNEKGTQVSFSIHNQIDISNTVPSVMNNLKLEQFTDRQIVCRQNEPSNDLFFIVSGRYAVYSNRKLVSVLTPSDIFIGEMAFLMNDRRSATVMSVGNGTLIRLHKADFLQLIRINPHYGLFLSRMLAQRLARQTSTTIKISNELTKFQTSKNNL